MTTTAVSKLDQASFQLSRGETAQAIAMFSEVLGDAGLPNDRRATIFNDRGVAYMRAGQAKEAIEDFNRATQLFPEFPAIYNNRGNLLLSLGLLKEAVKDFDRAITLAPGYAAAYNNRAGAYVRLGNLESAERDYSQAVSLLPTSPAPLAGRGRIHLALDRPHAAIRDFSRAVTTDARFASGYRNRAEAKLAVEQNEEAIEDLTRAVAFDVNNAEIYVVRGGAYLAMRNIPAALKDFAQAIALDPKYVPAYEGRGLANIFIEQFDAAAADLNRAIELNGAAALSPAAAVAFAYRGYYYKQIGQVEVGSKDVQTALKLDADRAEVLWVKGEMEEVQGQTDSALADYRKALEFKPGYRNAIDGLQRLGVTDPAAGDRVIDGAGVDGWQVVQRGSRFVAVNDTLPRLSVPLEMRGAGAPRILQWEVKEPPFKGFGVLRFSGGATTEDGRTEGTEMAALIDIDQATILGIEPHKQGSKVATWTWEEGKVTIAAVDGLTDEFNLRTGPAAYAGSAQRRLTTTQKAPGWAPWNEPMAGGFEQYGGSPRPKPKTGRKPKTIFDLLFN